jgi:uroporphyrinogen decarboxylase
MAAMRRIVAALALASAAALSTTAAPRRSVVMSAAPGDHDVLLRAARGEATERTPVWLMRQAGRYMADFRKYSDKIPFRQRSENPEIATELSLQCWKAFGVDGVIMFSDILTILPALGIEFDVVKGKGPQIQDNPRTADRVAQFESDAKTFDPANQLPFVRQTLQNLRKETEGKTTLVGFVGAPWTLCAYATEGGSTRHCLQIKEMMRDDPATAHRYLDAMADAVAEYACYQIESGAQMVQVFESWAHQLTPAAFEAFSKPYALRVAALVRERHPEAPVLFFANGGSSYLASQKDMVAPAFYNTLSLDWAVDMGEARKQLGEHVPVQGNIDPSILLGSPADVEAAVKECIEKAGGPGMHVLNLGHGVLQPTPEANVQAFVDAARKHGTK